MPARTEGEASRGSGASPSAHPVIFFDGVCNFCNRWVNWLMDRDRDGVYRFAALQSDFFRLECGRRGFDPAGFPDSILLLEDGVFWVEDVAVLRILHRLGGPWRALARVAMWVPRDLRRWTYRQVARHRYRMFGKAETCRVPTPEERGRFL